MEEAQLEAEVVVAIDFGTEYDDALAAADRVVQGYKQAKQQSDERAAALFAEEMKPFETVVRPVLKTAATQIEAKGAKLLIDHDEFYNIENDKRIPALHFQLIGSDGLKSLVYTFQVDGRQFSCNGDDGTKKPRGQRAGVFATSTDAIRPDMIEHVVSRAIVDITNQIQERGFKAAFAK